MSKSNFRSQISASSAPTCPDQVIYIILYNYNIIYLYSFRSQISASSAPTCLDQVMYIILFNYNIICLYNFRSQTFRKFSAYLSRPSASEAPASANYNYFDMCQNSMMIMIIIIKQLYYK